MTKQDVLDLYFIEARSKLLDLAAFIDRMERADGAGDFRWSNFHDCLPVLTSGSSRKTKIILELLSDPTTGPVPEAGEKGATGAWPGYAGRNP